MEPLFSSDFLLAFRAKRDFLHKMIQNGVNSRTAAFFQHLLVDFRTTFGFENPYISSSSSSLYWYENMKSVWDTFLSVRHWNINWYLSAFIYLFTFFSLVFFFVSFKFSLTINIIFRIIMKLILLFCFLFLLIEVVVMYF